MLGLPGSNIDRHSSRTELFFEYVAHCNATSEEPASYTTFLRVANKILGPHLRTGHLHFRKPNEHSKCDTCIRLKKACRKKQLQPGDSDAATRAYSSHILSQWLDRQIYWSFRSLSQSFFQQVAAGERWLDILVPFVMVSYICGKSNCYFLSLACRFPTSLT